MKMQQNKIKSKYEVRVVSSNLVQTAVSCTAHTALLPTLTHKLVTQF